jgi:hypoxanthine phosphoribosyltransferase
MIARSARFGTKYGEPQWRSEKWAILNRGVSSLSLILGRVVRGRCYLSWRMRPESGDFQEYSGTVFANEAEVECARLLDFYGIRWEYEPRSFPLETDEEGRVVEAFTPDFFLPEQELYLEVTVMKQSLVTRKNRKIRKFRERYPDVKVKLFTRRDFERLGQKYGLNLVT